MDIISKVITTLKLTPDDMSEIQQKTIGMDLAESNQTIVNLLGLKIEECYDSVKEELHIIVFLKDFYKTPISDSQMRISCLSIVTSLDYINNTSVDLLSIISQIIDDRGPEYERVIFSFVMQLNIPCSIIRMACVGLLKYPEKHNIIIQTLETCIKKNTNIIDKYYCLSLLNTMFNYNITDVTINIHAKVSNDIRLLNLYSENGFIIRTEHKEPESKEKIKELGLIVLSEESEPYTEERVYGKSEKNETPGGFQQNHFGLGDSRFVCGSDARDIDLNYISKIKSKFNGLEYIVKYTEIINRHSRFQCLKLSSEDYMCLVALLTENYNQCLTYCNKQTNKLLITKIAIELLRIGNEDIPDLLLSFIADTKTFDVNTRIHFAYCFKTPYNREYLQQSHDILRAGFYRMINSDKVKVNNLIA